MHQQAAAYTIRAEWDAQADRWVGTSPDIIGLVVEAASLPALLSDAAEMVPLLMPANGQAMPCAGQHRLPRG